MSCLEPTVDEAAAARTTLARFQTLYGGDVPPVDVEEVAASLCRLRVRRGDDLSAVAGVAAGTRLSGVLIPRLWEIWVRRDEPARRCRFTIAHEIGHHVLHSDGATVMCRPTDVDQADDTDRAREREANMFAAELIMPEALVREYADRDGADPVALSERFAVSDVAMAFRLVSLEYLKALPVEIAAEHEKWRG
jgi:IrrE N-terminal-like domain